MGRVPEGKQLEKIDDKDVWGRIPRCLPHLNAYQDARSRKISWELNGNSWGTWPTQSALQQGFGAQGQALQQGFGLLVTCFFLCSEVWLCGGLDVWVVTWEIISSCDTMALKWVLSGSMDTLVSSGPEPPFLSTASRFVSNTTTAKATSSCFNIVKMVSMIMNVV